MSEVRKVERPLSPHLQIYKPMLSMTMSIMHRITGAAMFFGTILLVWWLVAASQSDAYFDFVQGFFGHWFGRVILFGYTWALLHHMLGGVRHLIWDSGRGYDLPVLETMVRANLIGSIVLTLVLWAIGYGVMP